MKRKITLVMVVVIITIFLGFLFLRVKEILVCLLHIYGVVMLLALLVIIRLIPIDHSDFLDDIQRIYLFLVFSGMGY